MERLSAPSHPEGRGYPQMGDVHLLGVPEAYIQVDRLVRPFRNGGYSAASPTGNLKVPTPPDGNEATLAWVSRFERLDPAGGRPDAGAVPHVMSLGRFASMAERRRWFASHILRAASWRGVSPATATESAARA